MVRVSTGGVDVGWDRRLDPDLESTAERSFGHLHCSRSATGLSSEQSLKGRDVTSCWSLLLGGSLGFGESAGSRLSCPGCEPRRESALMIRAALVGEDVVGLSGARAWRCSCRADL